MKSHLILERFILISIFILAIITFSACTPINMQELNLEKLTQQRASGGDVYGGKQFVLPTASGITCEDGHAIKGIIMQNAAGVYTLVRKNCDNLAIPVQLEKQEVQPLEGSIEYGGEKYFERYSETELPAAFVQATTKWCRGKLSSSEAVGSTALIEFAEQADGQFKGQVAWLDYKDNRYEYYNAFEINLILSNLSTNGQILISGADVNSGISVKGEITPETNLGTATLTVPSSLATLELSCTGFSGDSGF